MKNTKCPVCRTDMDIVENGDLHCFNCNRHWYYTGNEEAPLASRSRKIKLLKHPEKGDHLNNIIEEL